LVVGTSVTWPSAFLLTAAGATIALVATGDVENVRRAGAYERVEGYVQDLEPELRRVLDELRPRSLAVSYALSDHAADGITHGWFLKLRAMLSGTPHLDRLASAEPIVSTLRARKLPEEIARIRHAVEATVEIFEAMGAWLRPGLGERDVFEFAHAQMRRRQLQPSWERAYDQGVNIGPKQRLGHAGAGEATLAPGRAGYEVAAAARQVILDHGFPEPAFAFGHMLGRVAHDGAGVLGPRWPRYGSTPEHLVEAGNVFALEFAVQPRDGSGGIVG